MANPILPAASTSAPSAPAALVAPALPEGPSITISGLTNPLAANGIYARDIPNGLRHNWVAPTGHYFVHVVDIDNYWRLFDPSDDLIAEAVSEALSPQEVPSWPLADGLTGTLLIVSNAPPAPEPITP